VKGDAAYESQVLNAIVKIRRKIDATLRPVSWLRTISTDRCTCSTAEPAPQLQASKNFLVLQQELRSTENRIAFALWHYTNSVMRYSAMLSTLPTNLVARLF
jgi:LemA protein